VLLLERRRSRSGSSSTAGGKLRRGLAKELCGRRWLYSSRHASAKCGLGKVGKLFSVGQLVSQATVERFGVTVFPG